MFVALVQHLGFYLPLLPLVLNEQHVDLGSQEQSLTTLLIIKNTSTSERATSLRKLQ